MFVRSGFPFNYDTNAAGDISGLDCSVDGVGRTKQSFREEVDINTIVRRFNLTGELPVGAPVPSNVVFDGVFDFQSAMNAVRMAEESFALLPAAIRLRFNNDAGRLVEFVSDDSNRAEAEKLGLVVVKAPPAPEPAPMRVVVVPESIKKPAEPA